MELGWYGSCDNAYIIHSVEFRDSYHLGQAYNSYSMDNGKIS